MSFFLPSNVQRVLHGRWLSAPLSDRPMQGVGIDTRADLTNRVYFAIRGDNHDGHSFLQHAANAGAAMLIVDRDDVAIPTKTSVLLVADTRVALAQLAAAYRATFTTTQVIGVLGSVGKTTTKRLIHSVLSQSLLGSASPKSFNNDIGVPLTLLAAQPHHDYVVVEIGTNHPGEIATLSAIARPDVAVITRIGYEHLEGLGSLEGVAREECAVLPFIKPGGLAILDADSPLLHQYAADAPCSVRWFGAGEAADLRLVDRTTDTAQHEFTCLNTVDPNAAPRRFPLALLGRHNALNALAAIFVAEYFAIDDAAIAAGLAAATPADMRLSPQTINGVVILNDAYNANFDSMRAALDTFAELAASADRRIIVLGDMLELGNAGPGLHRDLAAPVMALDSAQPLAHLVLIGPLMASLVELLRDWPISKRLIHHHALDEAALNDICNLIQPGDIVLLKGSRGMKLERIAERLATPASVFSPSPSERGLG